MSRPFSYQIKIKLSHVRGNLPTSFIQDRYNGTQKLTLDHLPCKAYTSVKSRSRSLAPAANFQMLLSRIASPCTEDDGEPVSGGYYNIQANWRDRLHNASDCEPY